MEKGMATIQLKYLTLPRLIDAAYMCGKDRQPVSIHIAGGCGIGKTFATKSIERIEGVNYFCASFTPNEYKGHVKQVCKGTLLFIHDDVGRGNPSYTKDYISTFCDLTEGHLEFRQFKKNIIADFNFSVVFTSTLGWYYSWKDIMSEMGYLDRVLPVVLELHPDTEEAYRQECQDAASQGCLSNDPAPRKLSVFEKHAPMQIYEYHINPRNLRNILRLSCYLTENEMIELIDIIKTDKPKYSI